MPRDAAIRRLLGSPDWSIRVVEANGDCFYAAVAHARGDGETTARSLRDAVADALDEDARDALLAARLAGLDEFAYVDDCEDLDALKARLRRPGGAPQCVWADDYAVRTVATREALGVLIIDEAARAAGRFVSVLPETFARVVVLQRTRRQHYNLLSRAGAATFSRDDDALAAKWPALRRAADDADDAPPAKRAKRTGPR